MTREDVCKVLNVEPNAKLYTKYNVHHKGGGVPAVNYQWGTITPFGSEIDIYVNYPGRIKLTDVETGEFMTIKYDDKYSHGTIEEYLKNFLTAEDFKKQSKSFPKKTLNFILAGNPVLGMTKDEVIKACGYPPVHRTPSMKCNTWVYWSWKFGTFTIIFDHEGKVIKGKFGTVQVASTGKTD